MNNLYELCKDFLTETRILSPCKLGVWSVSCAELSLQGEHCSTAHSWPAAGLCHGVSNTIRGKRISCGRLLCCSVGYARDASREIVTGISRIQLSRWRICPRSSYLPVRNGTRAWKIKFIDHVKVSRHWTIRKLLRQLLLSIICQKSYGRSYGHLQKANLAPLR